MLRKESYQGRHRPPAPGKHRTPKGANVQQTDEVEQNRRSGTQSESAELPTAMQLLEKMRQNPEKGGVSIGLAEKLKAIGDTALDNLPQFSIANSRQLTVEDPLEQSRRQLAREAFLRALEVADNPTDPDTVISAQQARMAIDAFNDAHPRETK
jgi:hypothetical protein